MWGRNDARLKGTKNFEAFGGLITKDFKEGLSGNGRKRVGMMIDAPFGESGVLIFTMDVSTKRLIGLEASHGMTERRVDIGLGKGERGLVMDGGREAGADRRGADIAVSRGGGETNDMVMEEERQGVGESSGG